MGTSLELRKLLWKELHLRVLSGIILVGSSIRLFADDRVAYRIIKSTEDHDHAVTTRLKHFSRMDQLVANDSKFC